MTRAICMLLFAAAAACQPGEQPGSEYMPDMARGPQYKAFAPNRATRNGITLQHPVAGTVARGYHPFHYGKGDAEGERAGRELTNPYHANSDVTAKGKVLYETYCAVCHGAEGKGDGPAAAGLNPKPANFGDPARQTVMTEAKQLNIVSKGGASEKLSPVMPSFGDALTDQQIHDVVAYIRGTFHSKQVSEK